MWTFKAMGSGTGYIKMSLFKVSETDEILLRCRCDSLTASSNTKLSFKRFSYIWLTSVKSAGVTAKDVLIDQPLLRRPLGKTTTYAHVTSVQLSACCPNYMLRCVCLMTKKKWNECQNCLREYKATLLSWILKISSFSELVSWTEALFPIFW